MDPDIPLQSRDRISLPLLLFWWDAAIKGESSTICAR
jgi:hypothetical protein